MKYPRRNQYPREITINRRVWAVVFCESIPGGDPKWVGYCCEHEDIIFIVRRISLKNTFETFCHEVMHAFEYSWKITIPHEVIYLLQRPIARLVRDNFL